MSNADSLLERLAAAPEDVELRERAARALMDAGRAAEAVAVLMGTGPDAGLHTAPAGQPAGFIHFNGHDPGALPCLCRRCIVPAETSAVVGGSTFVRDFVVAPGSPRGRVLFFWMPEELAPQRRQVRRSVLSGLHSRLPRHRQEQEA